jgi:hypothetical protein
VAIMMATASFSTTKSTTRGSSKRDNTVEKGYASQGWK